MKQHWKYIVISLVIGGFLGAALTLVGVRCYRYGGFDKKFGSMRQHLYKELKLSPEQKAQVDTILKTSREKMEAIRTTTRQEMRKILTPEQQTTFDAANARRDARREQRMKRFKKQHD